MKAIVTIIKAGDSNDILSNKLCSLIDKRVVKLEVNGMSLFSYYLHTSHYLRFDEIRTFVDNGADVNEHDSKGRTPLHWLVGHSFDLWQGIKSNPRLDKTFTDATTLNERLVAYLILKGANPCLSDNDGNNVLTLAIIYEQTRTLIEHIFDHSHSQQVNRRLIEKRNILGYNALDLYFRSEYSGNGISFSRLIELRPDPITLDHRGNNYLHNIFLRPVEQYKQSVDYNGGNLKVYQAHKLSRSVWSNSRLPQLLVTLIRTMGVNITHKNNSGLIPLQVALKSQIFDCDLRGLGCLVPADGTVLSKLVPKYPTNDAEKVWFVAKLTRYGFDFTEDNAFGTCMSNYSNSFLISHLIENGATPKLSDIMLAIKLKKWSELEVFSRHVLDHEIMNIEDSSRTILVQTLLSNDRLKATALLNLLRKGLQLKGFFSSNVTSTYVFETLDTFFDYITPELVVELNNKTINLIDDIILLTHRQNVFEHFERLVRNGLKTTAGFIDAFGASGTLAIRPLISNVEIQKKRQLKESVPSAHQLLLKMCSKLNSSCCFIIDDNRQLMSNSC